MNFIDRNVWAGTEPQEPSPDAPRWLRRTPSRILVALFATILMSFAAPVAVQIATGRPSSKWGNEVDGLGEAIWFVAVAVAAAGISFVLYRLIVRFTEFRSVTELNPTKAVTEWGQGLLLGAVLFVAAITAISLVGKAEIVYNGELAPALAYLASVGIIAGVGEELVFRGFIYRIVEESLGTWLALALSAVLFGAFHLANENATLMGAISIALTAGLLLGAIFVLTRRLWMVIGVHMAWNITQGAIFGATVSGSGLSPGLWRTTTTEGPNWISGGTFGPEASIFAVAFCLAAFVPIMKAAQRRNRIITPVWSRPTSSDPMPPNRM